MQFSEVLKKIRKDNKVTQTKLSEALKITDRTLRMYEAQESEPTLSALILIADYFGISMDYLAGRTDEPMLPKNSVKAHEIKDSNVINGENNVTKLFSRREADDEEEIITVAARLLKTISKKQDFELFELEIIKSILEKCLAIVEEKSLN